MYTTYGPGDPITWQGNQPLDDDSPLTSEARDHLLACPADWQMWLARVSHAREGAAFDVINVREDDMDSVCVDTLLACLFSGTRAQSEAARYELQSRFLRDSAGRLRQIEDQLWASLGDREPEFYDDI
jgi:hypothetical protein